MVVFNNLQYMNKITNRMLTAPLKESNKNAKAEEILENISFFEVEINFDSAYNMKPSFPREPKFVGWNQNDKSKLFDMSYLPPKVQIINESMQLPLKKTSQAKHRRHNSVLFYPKKVNLTPKIDLSFRSKRNNYLDNLLTKPVVKDNGGKNGQSCLLIQQGKYKNKFKKMEYSEGKLQQIFHADEKSFQKDVSLLKTQASYNVISFPLSAMIMRKKKLKQLQRFAYPSLTERLSK